MHVKTCSGLVATMLLAFAPPILVMGCNETEKDYVEYRADGLAFYDSSYFDDYEGDDYIERYLLYRETNEYERYIGGYYKRVKYDGLRWGTLYETGTYRESIAEDGETVNITFRPKKRYDSDTQALKPMAAADIEKETRKGEITEKTLEITYFDEDYILFPFFSSPYFTRTYTRK